MAHCCPHGLPPARCERRLLFGRDINGILGTINLTPTAQHAVLRIPDYGLLLFLVHPDHIHRTTEDTYLASRAQVMVDFFYGHR